MQLLTVIYPYYENPEMLRFQLENWYHYPDEVSIILVDDGSQKHPALETVRSCVFGVPKNLRLLRVKEDIPWNQHGARNLGAKLALTEWLFMSDICRVFESTDMQRLVDSMVGLENKYYKFHGWQVNGPVEIKHYPSDYTGPLESINGLTYQHPNSFLVRKSDYWKAGGYDEDYCGTYGGDGALTKSLEKFLPCETLNIPLFYYDHVFPDAKTNLPRKEGIYREKYFREMERKKRERDLKPKNPIRFEWEEIHLG